MRASGSCLAQETKKEGQKETGKEIGKDACEATQKSDVNGDVGIYTKRDYLKTKMKRCIWTSTSSHAFGMKCPVMEEDPSEQVVACGGPMLVQGLL